MSFYVLFSKSKKITELSDFSIDFVYTKWYAIIVRRGREDRSPRMEEEKMAKWGYLARAKAIPGFADRFFDCDKEDEYDIVKMIVRDILREAKNNFSTRALDPYNYRIIKQCERFLEDF